MFTRRIYPPLQTIRWTQRYIYLFLLLSAVPVLLQEFAGVYIFVPWLPLALIGTAVAFYVGFKNNTSYDRLWEARKIYGALVNTSRSWALQVNGYVTDQFAQNSPTPEALHEARRRLVRRHLAWLHAIRYQLRSHRSWELNNAQNAEYRKYVHIDEYETKMLDTLARYLPADELAQLQGKANAATHLLQLQMQDLATLRRQGWIDDFRHMELGNRLKDMYDQQGAAERIKNFPLPRQYASLNIYFVWLFLLLLPYGLLPEFDKLGKNMVWLTIPFSTLICWVFHTMEMIGSYSENPFEGTVNDVPITTLTRTIEIDLLQAIGETEVPPPLAPQNGISM